MAIDITGKKTIRAYKTWLGISGDTLDANLESRLEVIWTNVLYSHLYAWDWDFLEDADYQITSSGAGGYFDLSACPIKIIKSATMTSTGTAPTTGVPNLIPIPYELYLIYWRSDSTTNTDWPSYIAKNQDKLYTWQLPKATTSKVTVSGVMDYDNDSLSLIISIPDRHQEALFRYIDYKLGRGSYEDYLKEVNLLGGKPLIDLWEQQYGIK